MDQITNLWAISDPASSKSFAQIRLSLDPSDSEVLGALVKYLVIESEALDSLKLSIHQNDMLVSTLNDHAILELKLIK